MKLSRLSDDLFLATVGFYLLWPFIPSRLIYLCLSPSLLPKANFLLLRAIHSVVLELIYKGRARRRRMDIDSRIVAVNIYVRSILRACRRWWGIIHSGNSRWKNAIAVLLIAAMRRRGANTGLPNTNATIQSPPSPIVLP